MQWILWILIIAYSGSNYVYSHERIAPGVPPQHYQQPSPSYSQNVHQMPQQQVPQMNVPINQMPTQQMPQQQFPQQQMPQQQMPQQYQQQMPQMQQVPQTQQMPHGQQIPNTQHLPTHQVPNSQPHGHIHDQPQVLNAANIAHEKEHIAEHIDVPMDTSKMSEQELQFHYFKMHDADNNNKLDGCELIKSLIHWHEEGNKEPNNANAGEKIFTDEELVALIDPILDMDDLNKDGYIDYPEFIQAQQKAAPTATQQ